MHLHKHFRYFLREARVTAYAQVRRRRRLVNRRTQRHACSRMLRRRAPQFLESYKSVTVAMMASAFGVSPAFLDGELSDFIAAGRLNCKIDKARARGAARGALRACVPLMPRACAPRAPRWRACWRRTGRT